MSDLKDLYTRAMEVVNELRDREVKIAVEYLPSVPEGVIEYDLKALDKD